MGGERGERLCRVEGQRERYAVYSSRGAQCVPRQHTKCVGVAVPHGVIIFFFFSYTWYSCSSTRHDRLYLICSLRVTEFAIFFFSFWLKLLQDSTLRWFSWSTRRDNAIEGTIFRNPLSFRLTFRFSRGRCKRAAIECTSLNATGSGRSGSPCSPRSREQVLRTQLAPVAAMDARVVVGATPAAEETSVAVVAAAATRGVATPSPVPSAPSTATSNGNGGTTVVATLASASCASQNPVVVVANPSSNHQQPAGVPVAAVPRILSRNVNGTCKLVSKLFAAI